MRITLFTSNKNRHNYLINLLSEVSKELFVIQECGTILSVPGHYYASPIMSKYFDKWSKFKNKKIEFYSVNPAGVESDQTKKFKSNYKCMCCCREYTFILLNS